MKLPFFLDFSKTARQVREIDNPAVSLSTLRSLLELVEKEGVDLRYVYLDEIWQRAEKVLDSHSSREKTEILERLMRSARWSVQRIHSMY